MSQSAPNDLTLRAPRKWKREIGARIKSIRIKKGLDQTAFAHKIGVPDQRYVSRHELGSLPQSLEVWVKICQIGKVSMDWLMTGSSHVKDFELPSMNGKNGRAA